MRLFWRVKMSFRDLYMSNLENPTPSGNEIKANCPFKEEISKVNKSFSANIVTGQYHCHSCDASGNAIKFAKLMGLDPTPYYDHEFIKSSVDEAEVNRFHNNLMENPEYIRETWGLKVLEDLKVGYNTGSLQLTFPIFNKEGKIINLKYHKGRQTKGSHVNFYPWHYLDKYKPDYLIICEGEPDTITLLSYGFQAITSTGGANSIPPTITDLNKFKKIFLCPDNDKAGDNFIDKWGASIRKMNRKKNIRICDLSSYVEDKGDVSDYFSKPIYYRNTFISDILKKSRFFKGAFSDISYFLNDIIKSKWFSGLSERDLIVYMILLFRVNRYRVTYENFNNSRVVCQPGEWAGSPKRFSKYCGKDFSAKRVDGSWKFLEKEGKIRREILPKQKGCRIKVLDQGLVFCTDLPKESVKLEFPVFTTENSENEDESGTSVKDETVHIGGITKYISNSQRKAIEEGEVC